MGLVLILIKFDDIEGRIYPIAILLLQSTRWWEWRKKIRPPYFLLTFSHTIAAQIAGCSYPYLIHATLRVRRASLLFTPISEHWSPNT